MSDTDRRIGVEIAEIVEKHNRGKHPVIKSGKIVSVDEGAGTCVVQLVDDDEDTPTIDVMLNVVTGNANGIYPVPAADSQVWVAAIDGPDKLGLVRWTNVTKLKVNATTLIEFNGGGKGGVPVAGVTAERIKRLEDKLNDLVTVFNGWSPVPNDGGAALKAALSTSWSTPIAPLTVSVDLENENFKQ